MDLCNYYHFNNACFNSTENEIWTKIPPNFFSFLLCVLNLFFFFFQNLHWWSFNGGATADRWVDRQNHRQNVRHAPPVVMEVSIFSFELYGERNEVKPESSPNLHRQICDDPSQIWRNQWSQQTRLRPIFQIQLSLESTGTVVSSSLSPLIEVEHNKFRTNLN